MSEKPACVMCRYWTGAAESSSGECRRFGPVKVQAGPAIFADEQARMLRPWPTTTAEDWCYFHAPLGGIPGGRGQRLTNGEIVSAVSDMEEVSREQLIEKLLISGLSESMSEKRLNGLVARGELVEEDGVLRVGDEESEQEAKANQPETAREKKAAASRLTVGVFLPVMRLRAPAPGAALGFNALYGIAQDIQPLGKGTFTRLIREAVQGGSAKIHEGKYWFPVLPIDVPESA